MYVCMYVCRYSGSIGWLIVDPTLATFQDSLQSTLAQDNTPKHISLACLVCPGQGLGVPVDHRLLMCSHSLISCGEVGKVYTLSFLSHLFLSIGSALLLVFVFFLMLLQPGPLCWSCFISDFGFITPYHWMFESLHLLTDIHRRC
jgi:hypothetical protein